MYTHMCIYIYIYIYIHTYMYKACGNYTFEEKNQALDEWRYTSGSSWAPKRAPPSCSLMHVYN